MALDINALPMAHSRTEGWGALRAEGPVFESGGTWYVTEREGVEFVHRHPDVFSSAAFMDLFDIPLPLVPIAIDPPEHSRFRRILDPFLAPKRMAAMEPELRRQVGEVIDGFAADGRCEAVAQLAIPYPSQVFLTLFGLPLEDRDRLVAWKDGAIAASGVGEATETEMAAAMELFEYLGGVIAERRRRPAGDDLLSRLLDHDDPLYRSDAPMTDEELLGMAFLFVLAGLDTVTASIGFALHHLATDAALRREVVADPSRVPLLVEEIVRLESPAPLSPRVTTRAVELGGQKIPEGALVMAAVGCANREPDGAASRDDVDLDRARERHLGFGGGVHRCLGSHLARLELRLVLDEFHQRIPDYEVEPGATPIVPWPHGTINLDRLPLVW